jgi:hypothetical protein
MGKQTMNQKRVALLIVGALLVAVFAAAPVYAEDPPLPQAQQFYGTVEISGQPARVGTILEARGANVEIGPGNPITTTLVGQYGSKDLSYPKLTVQGDLADGSPIEFYINGFKAECAVPGGPWQSSFPFEPQAITELNLKVHLYRVFLPIVRR